MRAFHIDRHLRPFVGIYTEARSDALENTVFTILSPDGQRKLVRAGRSPSWAFRDGDDHIKDLICSIIHGRNHNERRSELSVSVCAEEEWSVSSKENKNKKRNAPSQGKSLSSVNIYWNHSMKK